LDDNIQFVIIQRCAGIPFFAAASFAFGQVTDELLFNHIIAYQYIINNYQIKGLQQK
jgi:hypothetical protein